MTLDLKAIRDRADKATENASTTWGRGKLAAAARTDIPALLDEIDRLEIDRDAWRLAFKDMVELKTQAVQRAETAEAVVEAVRRAGVDKYGRTYGSRLVVDALAAHDKAMK